MSATDDLRAAGFSDDEVNGYAGEKRQSLLAGGFSPQEVDAYLGPAPQPDTLQANKAFARAASNSIRFSSGDIGADVREGLAAGVDEFRGPFEAAANAGTGMVTGFPAYIGSALLGLAQKHLFGMPVDPKEMAETSQAIATYEPKGAAGLRMAGQLMYPLQKVAEGGDYAGHKVADVTGSPAAGAITDATIQMLPAILFGEFARKMSGQTVTADDMQNVAKVTAGPDAPPATVAAVEGSLRQTYDKTGVGPFTMADAARRDPELLADLKDPDVAVPRALEPYMSEPAASPEPVEATPLLDVSGPTIEEQGAGKQLNSGMDPTQLLSSVRDSYSPYVGVEKPEAAAAPMLDALQKIFSPASRGDVAETQAGIMRANFGEMAREREVALQSMKGFAADFDKLPVDKNIAFIDAMERGSTLEDPKLAAAASALRGLLDSKRDEVQALGKGQLENFDENYFPHMWKDADAAQALYARRPLTGSGAFLKARTVPLTTDGLRWRAYDVDGDFVKSFDTKEEAQTAAGADGRIGAPLKPITTNPVELALLKAREMDKYVYGQRIFEEMKGADLARFVPFGERAPPGWTKIDDKIARVLQPNDGEQGGMILRGEYYAPDEAATLMNNHLSPGLQGNGFYQAWRGIGMATNALQLGLSLFHLGFTTLDSMVSRVALGAKQISRGDFAQGVGNAAVGVTPAQPFLNIYKGDKLLRAYLGKIDSPDLAPIVDAIEQAGGRVRMDDFYRNGTVNAFKQALRNDQYFGAAKAFVPYVLDRMSAPIMESVVPRQKLGVFFDMAKDWLEKNPESTVAGKRRELGKLWDSVDNRMGQLVYDNVFWNRALKDGLMASVRSVGWNLGTFRELGGGVLDVKDLFNNKSLSDRTAYVIALPLVTAIYGAVTQYAYTGEGPRDMKDLFFPRTGRFRPDGSEDRVSLPTYMKDVFAYAQDATNYAKYGTNPLQTIANKVHPLISAISQMLNNADFFGGAIRNPADSAVKQVSDEAKFILQQVEPFSLRNYQQQAKAKGEAPSLLGYLTSPSMVGVTPAPGYIVKSSAQLESDQVSRMREPLIMKYREAIKDGADPEQLIPEMIKGGLSKQDIRYVIQSSGDVPKPHKLKTFEE